MNHKLKMLMGAIMVLSLVLTIAGCSTLPDCVDDPNSLACKQAEAARVGRIVKQMAFTGTLLALNEKPEWKDEFEEVSSKLMFLVADPTLTMTKLRVALEGLPIKELKSTEAVLVVSQIDFTLTELGYGNIDTSNVLMLKPIAEGLALGIQQAILQPIANPAPSAE